MTRKAYSYLRFSTPEQQQGDSFRRQTLLAEEFAARRGLELDTTLNLQDLGVSAFRSRNRRKGALGDFLRAVEDGLVEEGSFLLVENLDRLSRDTARRAMTTLSDICDLGITVVTLSDGYEYSAEKLDSDDGMSLLLSLMSFIRAHEESQMKSRRLRAAWQAKRDTAHTRPLTARAPHWLWLNRDEGRFEVIEERAKVVRRVFEEFAAGRGKHAIAKGLNADAMPTFGRAAYWQPSYVEKLLNNAAVIGTHIPHSFEHDPKRGRTIRVPLDPIEGYFPAIVDRATWNAVQNLKSTRSPGRGRHASTSVRNVIGGVAVCEDCGSTATRVSKGPKDTPRLVCTKAKGGAGCRYRSVRYGDVEERLLERLPWLVSTMPVDESHDVVGDRIDAHEDAIEAALEQREALLELAEGGSSPAGLTDRIGEKDELIRRLKTELAELRSEWMAFDAPQVEKRAEQLVDAAQQYRQGEASAADLNRAVRRLVQRVSIDFETHSMVLHYHHGTESEPVFFSLPKQ